MCIANKKVYIGQSKNLGRRISEHFNDLKNGKHHNQEIQRDYDKYGAKSFTFDVLYCGSYTKNDLNRIEQEEIEKHGGVESDLCYNVFSGGDSGYSANQKFRKQVSERLKGTKKSDSFKRFASEKAKRQWESDEFRAIMRESVKKQWESNEYKQSIRNSHIGKPESCGHILTAEIVREARRRNAQGESATILAREYGVAIPTMYSALRGSTWRNI